MKSILAVAVLALAPLSAHAADLTLPPGFKATVVFEGVGPARHIAVSPRGDLYISRNQPRDQPAPGILALRDTDGDGKFDEAKPFGDVAGTGIRFYKGDLYASSATTLFRYRLSGGELTPSGKPEVVIAGMPGPGGSRAFAFDDAGHVFVGVTGSGNTCTIGTGPTAPIDNPCRQLATRGGIWQFAADKTGLTFPADGLRFATGLRDMQGLDWNAADHSLYNAMQGRNGLNAAGSKLYTPADSENGVADVMHRVTRNTNMGWPYTHFDPRTMKRMQAPEYGGKPGDVVTDNAYSAPIVAFPAHSSPLDLVFYNARQFPAAYRGGAFVALHGGSDGGVDTPRDQNGYSVVFVPAPPARGFAKPVVFADGFAGPTRRPKVAEFRPSAVAVAPNGGLYVMDSEKGRIWRIDYVGTGKGRAAKPMVTAQR